MFFFNKIPLFRLVLPFTIGIIAGIYLGDYIINSSLALVFLLAILIVSFCALPFLKKIAYSKRWMFGIPLNTFLLSAGVLTAIVNTERFYPNHISALDEKQHQFVIQAIKNVVEKNKSFKLEAEVLNLFEKGKEKNINGKIILYLEKDSVSAAIKYGDILLVNAALQQVRETQNPAQFNYKQFLLFHQITRQAYISSESFSFTGINKGNIALKRIYNFRDYLLSILQKHGLEGREFAVGAALILGYTDELDPEIMRAYAGSGALHVLSVSGLHVGIMYVVVAWLLSGLDKFKRGNIIKAILLIVFLAFYAMITGLSPSVLRASVMFGFIVIAKAFNYHTNIYNTLAVSAISLLVYDPYLVMQVGFQLSYLAVIGIVAFQPLLIDLWEPKTKLMSWIWEITCVSIAAQIATAPLGFLYFHQFPVYFMISNLVVIPLSTGILYMGLATLLSAFIPQLCDYFTLILKWMIIVLNKSVEITEALPYSILGGIDISVTETWMLYFIVVSFFVFITQRNMRGLYVSLIALLIISVTQFIETIEQNSQQKFIVYNVAESSAYDVIQGTQNYFYAPSSLINDKDKMLFNIEHNWWKNGVNRQQIIPLDSINFRNGIFYFSSGEKNILAINNFFDSKISYTKKLNSDIVILSKNTEIKIEQVIDYFNPELIIFDSSNSYKICKKWAAGCKKSGIKYYDVSQQGAFIAEL
ncbi:MAG: ComEC/Rec2 family competence protein [Bacteroidia bacterium]